jgi:hypothetical protein
MSTSENEYTTIKVPKAYVAAARRLQSEMLRRGVEHLPASFEEAAQSTVCPLCGGEMRPVGSSQYLRCECGMAKHHVDLANPDEDVVRGIAIGALVGLGLYLVGKAIGRESTPERSAEASRRLDVIRARTKRGRDSTRDLAQAGRR